MCLSTVNILLLAPTSCSFEVTSFSIPNTTPSLPRIPMAVLHELDGNGETVFNQNHAGLVGLSLHTLTSCYKHTHCFQQPLWHTQFGTLCHLGRTVLLTSHTDGESGDVRHAGRRDKRPTRTPYPCPYWAHCPALASAAKLTWKKNCWSWITCAWLGMEWNGVTTGNGIGKRAWRSSDLRCCVFGRLCWACGLHIYSTPLLDMREWLSLKQLQFEVSTGVSMLEPAEKTAICILIYWIISTGIVILHVLCTNCVFGSM